MQNVSERKVDARYGIETFAKTKEEYIEYYDEHLTTKVEELEGKRKKIMSSITKQAIFIVPALLLLLILSFVISFFWSLFSIGIVLSAIYLGFTFRSKNKEIKQELKNEVVKEIVQFMNPNFTYEPTKYIAARVFNASSIFARRPNDYTGDDLIKGYVYDKEEGAKTNISFSEVDAAIKVIKKDKDGKPREERHQLFHGLLFKVEFNKSFGDAVTTVVPKAMRQANSWGTKRRAKKAKESGDRRLLEEVQLEDPEFMAKFNVFSNDQIYSRVILQADFMKKMLDFINNEPEPLHDQDNYAAEIKNMDWKSQISHAWKAGLNAAKEDRESDYIPYFSFLDNEMYFLLETNHEHFGFDMFTELNKEAIYYHFKDINRALQLIDDLHLNLKLYEQ